MNTTTSAIKITAKAFPMSIIKQAIAVCWTDELNLVPVLWAGPGQTKSSTINSLAHDLGYAMFDVRLSDKEASDLGGIPTPVERTFNGEVQSVLDYLANARLPWAHLYGDNFKCVLFLDEVDRTSRDVLNAALQLLLDRGINGFKLPKTCRVIAAGNGSSDTDTTRLNQAVVTRLCHFYVDTHGPKALDHWAAWAMEEGIDNALIGYARFRPDIFGGVRHEYMEQQSPNPRTFTWASKAATLCDSIGLPDIEEISDAIVFGLVGQQAGLEYNAYRATFRNCPTFAQVIKNPKTAPLPPVDAVGVLFALGEAFMSQLFDPGQKDAKAEVNPSNTQKVATYFKRCATENPSCREAVGWWFRVAGTKLPSLCGLDEYRYICG